MNNRIMNSFVNLSRTMIVMFVVGLLGCRPTVRPLPPPGDPAYRAPVCDGVNIKLRFLTDLPKPLFTTDPVYPEEALEKGIEGWVLLQFKIDKTGNISDFQVLDSSPPGWFEEAVIESTRKWLYRPAMVADMPVASCAVMPVPFRLDN